MQGGGHPAEGFWQLAGKFKVEPQPPERKLLYRRRGLSHSLSHTLNHTLSPSLSHVTYPSSRPEGPIVPRPREGHRRRFDEADKRWILEEAARPGASVSEVALRYGIDRRILCRWKQELTQMAPLFVAVEIAEATQPTEEHTS